jgi:hypothetical protein
MSAAQQRRQARRRRRCRLWRSRGRAVTGDGRLRPIYRAAAVRTRPHHSPRLTPARVLHSGDFHFDVRRCLRDLNCNIEADGGYADTSSRSSLSRLCGLSRRKVCCAALCGSPTRPARTSLVRARRRARDLLWHSRTHQSSDAIYHRAISAGHPSQTRHDQRRASCGRLEPVRGLPCSVRAPASTKSVNARFWPVLEGSPHRAQVARTLAAPVVASKAIDYSHPRSEALP